MPTSQTTQHVPRTPFLEGAVNDKGQKKVIDPITDKTRWITMRDPKVQSPTGVPVNPEQIENQNGPKAPTRR